MQKLTPFIQHYSWGSQSADNFVRQVFLATTDNPGADANSQHWAEAWMGTHPNGESKIKSNGHPLSDYLGNKLNYLFKMLSIEKCLSIQVHPNKQAAIYLREKDSTHYKDDMPKPEIAIALTELVAFQGFAAKEEINKRFHVFQTLATYINTDSDLKESFEEEFEERFLKQFSTRLLTESSERIKALVDAIESDLKNTTNEDDFTFSVKSALQQFGYDAGVVFVLLMNVVRVPKDCAIFIHPGQPHAYIKGEIIECMAASDNVIRVGLTEKFKDVDSFLEFGIFKSSSAFYYEPMAVESESKDSILFEYNGFDNEYFRVFRISGDASEGFKDGNFDFPKNSLLINVGSTVLIAGEEIKQFEAAISTSGTIDISHISQNTNLYIATAQKSK